MNEYRTQRLKEDLTYAQQRNKKQRQQLANYKKVHEKDLKEIERLNNRVSELEKGVSRKEEQITYLDDENFDLENEIERLNNIINELEKFLKISSEKDDYDLTEYNIGVNNAYNYTLDYLKELKESDKE